MKNKIIEEVQRLCLVADVAAIAVDFDIKGTTAGRFSYKGKDCKIGFNLSILENNKDEFLARTVPHEVAHYVRYVRNGYVHDRIGNRRDCHGTKWKAVMAELGASDVKRCHSFAVKPTRTYKKFEYSCDSGHVYQLTSIRHNRSQKGTMLYNCRECDSRLHFRGLQ